MLTPPCDTPVQIRSIRHTHWCWLANDVYDKYGPALGYDGLGCYIALARYANNRTGQCWPSLERLSTDTGATVEATSDLLDRLVSLGLITVQERPGRSPLITLLALAPELSRAREDGRVRGEQEEQNKEKKIDLVPQEEKEEKVSRVPSEKEQPEQPKAFSSSLSKKEKKTEAPDETSSWHKPPVTLPTDGRPDNALDAYGVTPEQREVLKEEALRRMAQQGKRLREEGGWETAATVHCLMCDIFEEWQASAPPTLLVCVACDTAPDDEEGCIHESLNSFGVCNRCGEMIEACAVAD